MNSKSPCLFDWFELYGELDQLKLHWKKKKKEEIQPQMLCFSVTKLPQPCQPNSMTEGDCLVTLQSRAYWLVSNSLMLCDILGSLFRGFTCVRQKGIVRREYFLSELLCEEQQQSLAVGRHELCVGSGYHWSRSAVEGSEMTSYESCSSHSPHQTGGWEMRT